MRLSIRWKLILAISLPLLAVSSSFLAYQHRTLKAAAYRQTGDYLQEYVHHSAKVMNGEFTAAAQVARSSAAFLEIRPELSARELEELVRANVLGNPFVYGSCVAFEPGAFPGRRLFAPYAARNVAAGADAVRYIDIAADAYDYRAWEWYTNAREAGGPIWTEPYFDEGAGNVVMVTYSVPFRRGGKVAGVATIDIQLEELQQWGRRSEIPGAAFMILSRRGGFISHPRADYIMKQDIFSAPTLEGRPDIQDLGRRLLTRDHGVERVPDFPSDQPSFLAHAVMPATGWIFMVALPEAEVMAPVVAQLRAFGLASLLSLLLILGIVFGVAVRITGPVRRLSAEITRVGEGNLEPPATAGYPSDEIGLLASSLSQMIGRLRSHIDALTRETAQREKVEGELRVARSIQASLIPQSFPAFPDRKEFDLHALLEPARYMAGDFYDFFFTGEDELVIAVADVAGKGVPAAMLMAVTRTLLRTAVPSEPSPARVLRGLNEALLKDNHESYFVSMTLGFYDVRSGLLRYANAGHPPALRCRPEGKIEKACMGTGPVLGILEDTEYGEDQERLDPGDTLVLFTDGVTEAVAPGGELYGDGRLAQLLANHPDLSPHELCDVIRSELDRYQAGNPADDVTVVVLRRA